VSLRISIEMVPKGDLELDQMLAQAVRRLAAIPMEDPRRIFSSSRTGP